VSVVAADAASSQDELPLAGSASVRASCLAQPSKSAAPVVPVPTQAAAPSSLSTLGNTLLHCAKHPELREDLTSPEANFMALWLTQRSHRTRLKRWSSRQSRATLLQALGAADLHQYRGFHDPSSSALPMGQVVQRTTCSIYWPTHSARFHQYVRGAEVAR
jgi:hypothetical protein